MWLDAIGSTLNIVGLLLVFLYQVPGRIDTETDFLIVESANPKEIKKATYHKLASYLGLFLLIISILIQLFRCIYYIQ